MVIRNDSIKGLVDNYAFVWSEVRLVIAALALFLGGYPPILYLNPIQAFSFFLWVCWLISGAVSIYMLYRWNEGGRMLFGGKDNKDMTAFLISCISGINLGLAGLLGKNIGMSFSSNHIIFAVVGIIYLYCAYHLVMKWKSNSEKIF